MNTVKYLRIICLLILTWTVFPAAAQHSLKEEKITQYFQKVNPEGMVWLENPKHRSAALFKEAVKANPRGATILLHDISHNLSSSGIIKDIATTLPEYGWATLSIQLPYIENENNTQDFEKYSSEINERIRTAIKWLNNSRPKNIVVVAHGVSAHAVLSQLSQKSIPQISAAVLLSSGAKNLKTTKIEFDKLLGSKVHIFDLYAANDSKELLKQARLRRKDALRAGILNTTKSYSGSAPKSQRPLLYHQKREFGADHNFINLGNKISKRILGWLKRMERTVK